MITVSCTIEVAFVQNPYGTLTWTDITSQVLGFGSRRGKNYELGQAETGELTMDLLNQDGRFDPTNTASIYYPYVLSRRPIRVKATYSGVTYGVFRGFVERWPQKWTDGLATVSITAVDGFKTVLGYTFGTRWDDYVVSIFASTLTNSQWWRFDAVSGGAGPNQASGSAAYAASTSGQTLSSVASLIAGSSNAATKATVSAAGAAATYTARNTSSSTAGRAYAVTFTLNTLTAITADQTIIMLTDVAGAGKRLGIEMKIIVPSSGASPFLRITTYDAASVATTTDIAASTFTVGVAAHLAFVRTDSGGTHTWFAYVNGVQVHTATTATGTGDNASPGVGLFTTALTGYTTVAWTVDEFTVGPMTASQIAQLAKYVLSLTPTYAEFAVQDSGARCGAILDAVLWPAGDRTLDTGDTTLQATGSLAGTTALTAMLNAATSELGRIFVNGSGKFVFQKRSHSIGASVATFGENTGSGEFPYQESITVGFDETYVYNVVQITQANSSPSFVAEASDDTSILTYGRLTLPVTIYSNASADCTGMANTLLARYKDEHPRVPELQLEGMSNPALFPQMLGREIGDVVTVTRRPFGAPTLSFDCIIEGVSHDVTPNQWVTTFLLSPKPSAATY